MSDSYVSVVTAENITCGTLLGPLPLNSGAPDSLAVLTWRCVDNLPTSKQVLKAAIKDRSSSKVPSWTSHILPARNPEEQTLEVVVKTGHLYFRALRDVSSGEELRAWFGRDLADILKLPMIPPTTVEDGKKYECMLCQEQFENPFPVVTHLMYRCRYKDHGISSLQHPFRKRNGGRVKNFDIATLTDMNDNENIEKEDRSSPVLNLTSSESVKKSKTESSPEDDPKPRKRKSDHDTEDLSTPKKSKHVESKGCDQTKPVNFKSSSAHKSIDSAFKVSSGNEYLSSSFRPAVDINSNENNSSAFKKVDKSSTAFHSNINPNSSVFPTSLDPRDMIFQGGPNGFAPFSYAIPSTASSPPCATLPQNGSSGLPHPVLTSAPIEIQMTSAFAPGSKLPATISSTAGNIHQLKLSEELKAMRKIQTMHDNGYELSGLLSPISVNGSRISNLPTTLNYVPKSQSMDNFGATKAFPTPLLPFLPPSLAALSFPTQNWCAKCNASFRMTSDLVYHMRSHHKRETDPQKLKREEKLRCHICNETFRERHHLTRHMTSHQ